MSNNTYHFEPKFSLTSNQITFFNEVSRRVGNELKSLSSFKVKSLKSPLKDLKSTEIDNFNEVNWHNYLISDNAFRTLRKKMTWLYYLSKPRHIVTYNRKNIYSFKMCFLTLTLSSSQVHPTSVINKELLNQFLTEVRQRTKMTNYIWRLEFQANGNVHYHLATDTYLDYYFVKEIWNRLQSKLGYVQPYTQKHKKMSLSDYVSEYSNDKNDFSVLAKRYAKGKKDNWESPPSVDVKSVISGKSITNYISKYFAKNDESKCACNELDNYENSKSVRLWFCSRSLSKLNTLCHYVNEVDFDVKSLFDGLIKIRKVFLKYTTVFYFDIKNITGFSRVFLEKLLKQYAKSTDYIPSY